MIRNSVNKLYVGISKQPQVRVVNHNKKQGAKFTKHTPDFEIVFLEEYENLKDARKRETQIKKWNRKKKEDLIGMYLKKQNTKQ